MFWLLFGCRCSEMIHCSMFLKLWIKLCPRCQIVIDFRYTPPELLKSEKWTKEFIARYSIASKDWKVANSNGGTRHNQNCKAYQKFI